MLGSRSVWLALAASLFAALTLAAQASAGSWKFAPTINAPWAQENAGDVLNSPDLSAVALCRSTVFNGANPYAATTNTDVIVGDAVNNSGASNFGCTTPQNETTVAVNPTDPLNIAAGSNDYRICCDFTGLNDASGWAYVSHDGGHTWANILVPGLTDHTGGQGNFKRVDSAGDPALAFGPDGTLYYANIVFSRVSFASGVAVNVSHDGGLTWDAPNLVAYNDAGNFFNDKEWIAAGADGNVVVTWTRFNLGPKGAGYRASPIVAGYSKDGGKTWNRQGSPVSDGAHPFDQGSFPQYAPDGTLYVAYEGASPSSGYAQDQTLVARSTDNGQSFTNTEVGRVYDDLDCYPVYNGRQTLTGEHFRLNSYPSFSVDPTSGKLALVWADNQGSGTCGTGQGSFTGTTNTKLKLVTSSDGVHFSAVRTLTAGDVVFPAIAMRADKAAVSYYTRAYSSTHSAATCNWVTGNGPNLPPVASASSVCLDYAALSSSDNFAAQHRLTTEGSNPYIQFANGGFIGDYSGIAIGSDGTAWPVWTDFRGNPNAGGKANQDVYTQPFTP